MCRHYLGFLFPNPLQHLLLFVFLIVTILTGVSSFDSQFLIAKDIEHFWHVFFWPFVFHLLRSVSSSFAHLLIGLVVLLVVFMYSGY
jgi:hypothetical protein